MDKYREKLGQTQNTTSSCQGNGNPDSETGFSDLAGVSIARNVLRFFLPEIL